MNSVFRAWFVYARLYELGVKDQIVSLLIADLSLIDEKDVTGTQKPI